MESDKSHYFGTCFSQETTGRIIPRLRCLPLTRTVMQIYLSGAAAQQLCGPEHGEQKTELHTCQHLCPLEEVLGADLNGLVW